VFAVSATGFMFLSNLPLDEAVYLAVATMTTVGYGDIVPSTEAARWFSLLVMLSGVSIGFYAVGLLSATLVEGRLFQLVEERRMRKTIESITQHFIICGYGQLGSILARELEQMGAPFVIVERNADACAKAREAGFLVVQGDATDETALLRARIEQARGLATVISDDAENLYITVSSRSLHPDLPIVARASRPRGGRYLTQSGATSVIFLDQLGASRIARSLLRPDVVTFLEELMGTQRDDLRLEALRLPSACRLTGRSLKEVDLRGRYGIQVLAVKRQGEYIANPPSGQTLNEEDVLVVVGHTKGLTEFADHLEDDATRETALHGKDAGEAPPAIPS
jgi:voltage-gated potassium channel